MANDIGSLAVQVTGNTTGLAHALKSGEGMLHGFTKKASGAGTAVWSGIGAAGGMLGGLGLLETGKGLLEHITGFVTESIKIAAEMEDVAASFKTMTGDAGRGAELFGQIKEASKEMRLNVRDTAEAAKDLLGADVAADQIVPTLRMLGDIALGDAEKLKALASTYGLLRQQGMVTSKQLKSLPLGVRGELAKQLGVPTQELKGIADDVGIPFYQLQKAMAASTSEGGEFFEGTAHRAETLKGRIDILKDTWEDFKWDLGQMVIEEFGLKDFVSDLTKALDMGRGHLEEIRPLVRDVASLVKEGARGAYQFALAMGQGVAQFADFLDRNKGRFKWLTETPRDTFEGTAVGDALGMGREAPGGRFEAKFNEMKAGLDSIFKPGGPIAQAGTQLGQAAGAELKKAAGQIKIDPPQLTDQQRNLLKGMRDEMDPAGAFRREAREFGKAMAVENLDPMARDRDLLQFGVGRIFQKHFPDAGEAKLAAAALKDSAEAISAIAQHQVGGGQDVQARIAAAVEAAKAATERGAKFGEQAVDELRKLNARPPGQAKPLPK